ncbi:Zinc finger protein [Globisporangium polare]
MDSMINMAAPAILHTCDFEGCDRQFNRKYTLAEHAMTHTGEKPHVCPVPTCAKSFSTSGNLSRHKRLHGYIEPLKCPVQGCVCTFPSNNKLSKHMKFHFGSEDVKVCVVVGCGKTFSTTGNLNRHLKTVHDGVAYDSDSDSDATSIKSSKSFECSSPIASNSTTNTSYSPTAADQWMPQQTETFASLLGSTAPAWSFAPIAFASECEPTPVDSWDVLDTLSVLFDDSACVSVGAPASCDLSLFQRSLEFECRL